MFHILLSYDSQGSMECMYVCNVKPVGVSGNH